MGLWDSLWKARTTGTHPGDCFSFEEWGKAPGVKDIRAIRTFSGQQAVGGAKYIAIPQADKLSREVANALLKLLEEPPMGVHVILFGETDRMLATVRSRVSVQNVGAGELSEERLIRFYQTINAFDSPHLARKFLYYAPLLHATLQSDVILDAFQS